MQDATPLTLVVPARAHLESYTRALEAGWSASTSRDISGEQLAAIRTDGNAFLASLVPRPGETITLPGGRKVARLPGFVRWMWDGEIAGSINFRHVPGTEALPDHVLGHIGYAVVPWKRRRGYAGRALAMMLALAREAGMARVEVCCDSENTISRRVIEGQGGALLRTRPNPDHAERTELVFRLACPSATPA